MASNNSQFFFNALKIFSPKIPQAIIYAADFNEATDEIEALEVVLGTGLRTRTPVSWDTTSTSFPNLTARLNSMDAGIRSTNPNVHPQYAVKSGTVLQPTDGTSAALTIQGDPANAADLLHITSGDTSLVISANSSGIRLGKPVSLTQPMSIVSGSVPGLTFTTNPGYNGNVIQIGNGTSTSFAIRADGTVTSGSLTVTTSPTIGDFSNMQHDHSSAAQGGRVFPPGCIIPFAGIAPPTGWLLCTGQAVNRIDYAALYGVIGNSYGVGDGVSTFNIPDMRGRFPMGRSASGVSSSLGATGGTTSHTLTTANMPAHSHSMSHSHGAIMSLDGDNHTHQADGSATSTSYFLKRIANPGGYGITSGVGPYALNIQSLADPTQATGSGSNGHTHNLQIDSASGNTSTEGSGGVVDHTPPFLALNYIIKT